MKMELYCPVRSLAGHDKNQYFIIVSDEGEYITMENGTTRKVDDPKRKNKKHIQAGKTPLFAALHPEEENPSEHKTRVEIHGEMKEEFNKYLKQMLLKLRELLLRSCRTQCSR